MTRLRLRFFEMLSAPVRPPSLLFLWASGTVLFQLFYTAIFAGFGPSGSIAAGAVAALTNVLPLALLAITARAVLKTYVMPLGVMAQGAAHLLLGPTFALLWYASVILLQSLLDAAPGDGVRLVGFNPVALIWQAFQGLVIYALIAAVCYAARGGREAAPVSFVEARPPLDRYLIRSGDELLPIAVGDIVAITGAQDYSEVSITDGRRHLVRLSLGEFERRLDTHRFVRVHRSAIVNLDRLDRLEPAGNGRMIAHLQGSESVEVSRSGAQLLRRFVV